MTRKKMFVLALTALLAVSGIVVRGVKAQSNAAPHGAAGAPAAQAGGKKAEEQFKNIQVLKGVPADQIFPTMQFITASLGVGCEFCHVEGAFEKDDKKNKETARKMMEMMFAINADNFDRHREVTCNTCHRGSATPVAIPAVMMEEENAGLGEPSKPVSQTKGNDAPTADQLLEKYVQAAGGGAAIE